VSDEARSDIVKRGLCPAPCRRLGVWLRSGTSAWSGSPRFLVVMLRPRPPFDRRRSCAGDELPTINDRISYPPVAGWSMPTPASSGGRITREAAHWRVAKKDQSDLEYWLNWSARKEFPFYSFVSVFMIRIIGLYGLGKFIISMLVEKKGPRDIKEKNTHQDGSQKR